jgi:hypothetical protein
VLLLASSLASQLPQVLVMFTGFVFDTGTVGAGLPAIRPDHSPQNPDQKIAACGSSCMGFASATAFVGAAEGCDILIFY